MRLESSFRQAETWSVRNLPESISYLFKLVFLGEGAVGKTSLVGRYVYDSFEGDYLATIGTDIHVKTVLVDDTMVKLVVWDIAGQDDFAQLRKAYYQNASGAFFVFDCTRPETVERFSEWVDALFGVTKRIPLVLVENKIDLDCQVDKKKIDALVKKYDITHVQTSAKEDTNVEEAFRQMTREILSRTKAKGSATI
ncbi:MAG: Rab family GTPase [Candidatus Thorarchaeota archaeon]